MMGKTIYKIMLLVLALVIVQPVDAGDGPSQPEAMQFESVDATDIVNLATGDMAYTLPLIEVPGPEGGYPIVLSYHAGIGPNQEATWVGLGWALNSGAINRTINGYADDYKNADVVTTYAASERSGWGINISAGWGPVGLNMGCDSENAKFGVNAISVHFDIPETGIGVSLSYGRYGFGYSASLGSGIDLGGGNTIGAGISIGNQGIGFYGGLSHSSFDESTEDYTTLNLVGFSIHSGGNSGFSVASVGVSSYSAGSGKGIYEINEQGGSIPLPFGFKLGVSFYEWSWRLDELHFEYSFGYIHQKEYHSSGVNHKKYERNEAGDYLYSAQDIYNVAGQGVTGTMQPFVEETYRIYDYDADNKAYLSNQLSVTNPHSYNTLNPVRFRFLNDVGGNSSTYITSAERSSFIEDYENIFSEPRSSSIIEHIIPDAVSGAIEGFRIIKEDGVIYEFMEPVKNKYMYSKTEDVGNSAWNENYLFTPFAVNWLITSIKGPDYYDADEIEGCSDGDWGYWVKFNYTQDGEKEWRAPYEGYQTGTSNANVRSFSLGIRETVTLSKIETATHEAVFNTVASDNRLNADLQTNNVKCLYAEYNSVDDCWDVYFSGDLRPYIDNPPGTNPVIFLAQIPDPQVLPPEYLNIRKDELNITGGLYSYSYNSQLNRTILKDHYNGYPSGGLHNEWWVNIFFDGTDKKPAPKLTSIELKNKAELTTTIKGIEFEYDYKLCAGTPSSSYEYSLDHPFNGSKLTLKEVRFIGKNGAQIIPEYKFEYFGENSPRDVSMFNPSFGLDNWDRWGSYRYSTEGVGPSYHNTPQNQTEADYAKAWSLNRITTPTGAVVDIDYESDDYYYVNGMIDFENADQYNIVNARSENPVWYCTIDEDIPDNIYLGADVYIYETITEEETIIYPPEYNKEKTRYIGRWKVSGINSRTISFPDDEDGIIFHEDDPGLPPLYNYKNYSYKLLVSPSKVFGGGIRVKKVSTSDGINTYTTNYKYTTKLKDEQNFEISSGTLTSLRAPYGNKPFETDLFENKYNTLLDNNLLPIYNELSPDGNYGCVLPPAAVVYSQVEVINSSGNGKTVYELFTSKDYATKIVDDDQTNSLSIKDYSGIIGRPKAIKYYEQYEYNNETEYRLVKEDKHFYVSSDSLGYYNRKVLDKGSQIVIEEQPLGIISENFEFKNGGISDNISRFVNRVIMNFYPKGSKSNRYYYDSPTSNSITGTLTTEVKNLAWDALSGQSIGTANEIGEDSSLITQIKPAYWFENYSDMESKNMITQNFQTTSYGVGYDIENTQDLVSFFNQPENNRILTSGITTWSNQWHVGETETIWRKNESYAFNRDFNFVDFPSDSLNRISDLYPNASSSFPWYMTSNISKYDKYSHPTEESHRDGSYTSSIYSYCDALPTAIATNAKQGEFGYISFEDGWEDWEAGGTREEDQDDCRTGEWKVVTYQYGPTKNFFCQNDDVIDRSKTYIAEAWVKLIAGTAALVIEKRNDTGTYLSRKHKYLTSGAGWQLITLELEPGDMSDLTADGYLRVWAGGNDGSSQCEVDDIRFYPKDASMSTYTYDPLTWKLTSITDENNITTFFDYDDKGRLIRVKNQDGKIIKKHEYNFALDN